MNDGIEAHYADAAHSTIKALEYLYNASKIIGGGIALEVHCFLLHFVL